MPGASHLPLQGGDRTREASREGVLFLTREASREGVLFARRDPHPDGFAVSSSPLQGEERGSRAPRGAEP